MPEPTIESLVADFTNQLTILVRRSALENVLASLGGSSPAPRRRGPGRPRGSGRKPGRPAKGRHLRRSPAGLEAMQAKLLVQVKTKPGQRGEQIAKALRTDVGTMRGPMEALIKAKTVKTTGQRRRDAVLRGVGRC